MSITIELPADCEQSIRRAAAQRGRSVSDYARELLIDAADREEPLPERNERVIALMDEWLNTPVDEEEAEGYPETITPLSLREVRID